MLKDRLRNNSSLIESFFSLSLLSGLSLLMPLVTMPYIVRVVGAANFGVYSYVYVLIIYLQQLSNYGFAMSATKQVAQNRDNPEALNRIYNGVTVCRFMLFLVGILAFAALSPLLLKESDEKLIFLLGLGFVLGDVLNPVWLFQGMEKMRYMTIVQFISRLLFTLLIFVLIRQASDYKYIILYNSLGVLLAGIVSTIFAQRQFGVRFALPKWKDIKFQMIDGAALFFSTIGVTLYTNVNVFILNFFVPKEILGIYAAAEKIINGLKSLCSPISQALFPHFSHSFGQQSRRTSVHNLARVSKILAVLLLLECIVVYFCADWIVQLLCGEKFLAAVPIVRLMCPVILIGALNYLWGVVGLVNLNLKQHFLAFVLLSGVTSVSFLFVMVQIIGVNAAPLATILAESVLLIACFLTILSYRKRSIKNNEWL